MTMLAKIAAAIGDQHWEGDSFDIARNALARLREPDDAILAIAETAPTGYTLETPEDRCFVVKILFAAVIDAILNEDNAK